MRGGAGTWVYVERCGCSACSALAILVLQPAIAKLGGVFFFFFTLPFFKDRVLRPLSNLCCRRFKTIHVRNHILTTLDNSLIYQSCFSLLCREELY